MKKIFRGIALAMLALFAAFALTGCGGGGNDDAPVAVAVKPPADVILRTIESVNTPTPGERYTALVAVETCPFAKGTTATCAKDVPLGDIIIKVVDPSGKPSARLENIELTQDGRWIGDVDEQSTGVYRVRPEYPVVIRQFGTLEVRGVLSPYAAHGEVLTVSVNTVSAAPDRSLELVAGVAKTNVVARPHLAPAQVAGLGQIIPVVNGKGWGYAGSMQITCPATNISGCFVGNLDVNFVGATNGGEVQVYLNGTYSYQYFIDTGWSSDGQYDYYSMSFWVAPGETMTVDVYAGIPNGYTYFDAVTVTIDGKEIKPKIVGGGLGMKGSVARDDKAKTRI